MTATAACTVLYVDDEPELLELGKMFLESTGDFVVTTRLSGEETLEILRTHSYDAIVSDYQMPGTDGLVLLKTVRERYGNIPFILFTGRGREAVVIGRVTEEHPGKVAMRNAYGVRRVIQVLASDQFPRIC